MADRRTVQALLLLGATAAILGGLWLLGGDGGGAGPAQVGLAVVEPDGSRLFEGDVEAANGTALGALEAGAEAGGFPYETETHSMGLQVVSVNGTENEGSSGWVYRVRSEGEWCWGDRSPDRYEVDDGDRVRWEWADEPPGGGCGAEPHG